MNPLPMLQRFLAGGLAALVGFSLCAGQTGDPKSLDPEGFSKLCLKQHNDLRKLHHSPDLVVSEALTLTAQDWANRLAASGELKHSPPEQRHDAGENLYIHYTTEPGVTVETLADLSTKAWYEEGAKYPYDKPGFSSETGHFTQMIWKKSTDLGCGIAQGTKTIDGVKYQAFYVVCHYAPAGNVEAQFAENVEAPKKEDH